MNGVTLHHGDCAGCGRLDVVLAACALCGAVICADNLGCRGEHVGTHPLPDTPEYPRPAYLR